MFKSLMSCINERHPESAALFAISSKTVMSEEIKSQLEKTRTLANPVSTRRSFDVNTTLFGRQQHCYNVETTLRSANA